MEMKHSHNEPPNAHSGESAHTDGATQTGNSQLRRKEITNNKDVRVLVSTFSTLVCKVHQSIIEISSSLMPSQPICATDICQWHISKTSAVDCVFFVVVVVVVLLSCFEPILSFTVKSPRSERSASGGGGEETSRNSSLASGKSRGRRSYTIITLR